MKLLVYIFIAALISFGSSFPTTATVQDFQDQSGITVSPSPAILVSH